jgi:hypothetical protein
MNTKSTINPWTGHDPTKKVNIQNFVRPKAKAAPPAPDNTKLFQHVLDPKDRLLIQRWDSQPNEGVYYAGLFSKEEHERLRTLLAIRHDLEVRDRQQAERDRLNGTTAPKRALPYAYRHM